MREHFTNNDAVIAAFRRMRCGDDASREALIEHYRYLVVNTRKRVVPSVPARIDPADLDQEGYVALVKSVDKFDPDRGIKFITYGITCIRGAILEYLRQEDYFPRGARKKQKSIESAELGLAEQGVQNPTPRDYADHLDIPLDSFYQIWFEANLPLIVSLDNPSEEEEFQALERLKSDGPDPEENALVIERKRLIEKFISALPSDEREIISRYYWGNETMVQIGKRFDRSPAWVSQKQFSAILRLSQSLMAEQELFGDRVPRRKKRGREPVEAG